MKTLADVKRRLTVGTVLVMTWHRFADGIIVHGNLGASHLPGKVGIGVRRKIVKAQSSQVAFHREYKPDGHESWFTFPKASELRIDGPDSFTVLEDGEPLMSYTFEEAS